jgi:hypothetical protein
VASNAGRACFDLALPQIERSLPGIFGEQMPLGTQIFTTFGMKILHKPTVSLAAPAVGFAQSWQRILPFVP